MNKLWWLLHAQQAECVAGVVTDWCHMLTVQCDVHDVHELQVELSGCVICHSDTIALTQAQKADVECTRSTPPSASKVSCDIQSHHIDSMCTPCVEHPCIQNFKNPKWVARCYVSSGWCGACVASLGGYTLITHPCTSHWAAIKQPHHTPPALQGLPHHSALSFASLPIN